MSKLEYKERFIIVADLESTLNCGRRSQAADNAAGPPEDDDPHLSSKTQYLDTFDVQDAVRYAITSSILKGQEKPIEDDMLVSMWCFVALVFPFLLFTNAQSSLPYTGLASDCMGRSARSTLC